MMLRIGVKQSADHALILRIVSARLVLEEFDATLAQGNGHFHAFIPEDEILRARQEIRNDPEAPEGLVRVLDSLAHRFAASAKDTPCFFWFLSSLSWSQSNRVFAIGQDYHDYGLQAIRLYGYDCEAWRPLTFELSRVQLRYAGAYRLQRRVRRHGDGR